MNKRLIPIMLGLFFCFTPAAFSAQVISDAELDKITGQTGIMLNVILDALIGDNYSEMKEEDQAKVRQMIEDTFGPLTRQEVDQIINSHLMFADMIQQLPEEDRKQIEEAYDIITAQLKEKTPVNLLAMSNGDQITADSLNDWAQDKVNKILIAQQIINDMIQALSPEDYRDMMTVQEIVNQHLDSLKY